MFDFVRTHKRLLQFFLVLLLFPAFAFFGVQGYSRFFDGGSQRVASVAGRSITQAELDAAHRQQIERLHQQMPGIDGRLLDAPEFKQRTLDGLVQQNVLLAAAQKDHLVITDERLQRLFVSDGRYANIRRADGSVNAAYLAARGLSSQAFAEQLRRDYAMQQVVEGAALSHFDSHTGADTALNALLEQREIQWQRFNSQDYLARMTPAAADVQAYYEAHKDKYRSAEEADIEYVMLDPEALRKQVRVSQDDLHKYYDENRSRYTVAEERRASHILIAVDKAASAEEKAKAKATAEALLAQARKDPGAFAELARKHSQDPVSAAKGGDLDFFGRGAMVKPFEDAVFAMKPGEIANLVESDFGYHIIRLTEVRGGNTKTFDAVRPEIEAEIGKQLAQKRYAEVADIFTNTVYEQPDSLQPVIDKLQLAKQAATVRRTPAPGASGPLASAKLLDAVFAADALKNKRNTEAVETGTNQLAAAHVLAYRPERVLALDEVRDQVTAQVRTEQAAAAARKDGQARLAALRADGAQLLPLAATVSRTQPQAVPRAVLVAVLQADVAQPPAILGVDLGDQGYAVVKVTKTLPANAADAQRQQAAAQVENAAAEAEAMAYFNSLKKRFKVDVKLAPASAAATAAQ